MLYVWLFILISIPFIFQFQLSLRSLSFSHSIALFGRPAFPVVARNFSILSGLWQNRASLCRVHLFPSWCSCASHRPRRRSYLLTRKLLLAGLRSPCTTILRQHQAWLHYNRADSLSFCNRPSYFTPPKPHISSPWQTFSIFRPVHLTKISGWLAFYSGSVHQLLYQYEWNPPIREGRGRF